jgi:hypothetical protein
VRDIIIFGEFIFIMMTGDYSASKGSLSCLQGPTCGHYPESDESNPHFYTTPPYLEAFTSYPKPEDEPIYYMIEGGDVC